MRPFFLSRVASIIFAIFNISDWGNPALSNAANRNSIQSSILCSMEEQNSQRYSHYLKLKVVFFSLNYFKTFFLETLFFKSSTSKCCISENLELRRLREVSIDPKFYLVLGSGHDSILQKWDRFKFTYINIGEILCNRENNILGY